MHIEYDDIVFCWCEEENTIKKFGGNFGMGKHLENPGFAAGETVKVISTLGGV